MNAAVRAVPGWSVWLAASRPATLPAAVVPVLVGAAAAYHDGGFRGLPFAAALAASLLIQIGTNLANDVFDFERGADVTGRLGPPRVTQTGLASPGQVRLATLVAFGAAAAIGLYLVAAAGWPVLVVGVLAIASGIAYTGGPWPLGYHGLGDFFVFVFFGLVAVAGTYYVQAREIASLPLAASLPVACTVTAILVVNNLRDIETDARTGKRTLAVRLGAPRTRIQYALLVLAPFALVAAFVLSGTLPLWTWLSWLTLPFALALARRVAGGAVGAALNPVLKQTAQLHLLLGVLLAAGLLA